MGFDLRFANPTLEAAYLSWYTEISSKRSKAVVIFYALIYGGLLARAAMSLGIFHERTQLAVGLSCGLSLVIVWLSNRCRKRAGSCVILDACVVVANTASYMAFLYVLRASNVCPAPAWQAWVGPSSVCARLGVACSIPEAVKLCAYGSQLLSRVTLSGAPVSAMVVALVGGPRATIKLYLLTLCTVASIWWDVQQLGDRPVMMIDWAVWTFETIFCMVFATILNWRAEYRARYQFLTAAARPNYTPSKTTPGCSRASALFIFLVMALVAAPIMSTLITSVLADPERLGLVPTLMMNLLHFVVFYVIQIHLYL